MILGKKFTRALIVFYIIACIIALIYFKVKENIESKKETNSKTNKKYLYWNGDLFSTYQLITYVLEKIEVQPIYFENKHKSLIKKLYSKITNLTEEAKDFLHPLIIVPSDETYSRDEINQVEKFMHNEQIIRIKNKSFKMKIKQILLYMEKHNLFQNIYYCLDNIEQQSHKLSQIANIGKIQLIINTPVKIELYAEKNKFNNILELTHTCQNINIKTKNNCKKCIRCLA